ncbi:MAG TPA: DUF4382 domain-containing protein [Candidatus Saccharimonadales bacterium]|nr:DUF4382 domain-containing protein [Candidatus Saccharimonadales bacterium]
MKKVLLVLGILVLIGGVAAGTYLSLTTTNTQQHASNFSDLNSADQISQTNNADGTMGPLTWLGNYSNRLPAYYLGSLSFQVTDPIQGARPTEVQNHLTTPTVIFPTNRPNISATPTPANTPHVSATPTLAVTGGTANTNSFGPQKVSSLILSISKVEVHLAHLALPGQKDTEKPDTITTGKPSVSPTPHQQTNQDVDKWETLNLPLNPATQTVNVDLVALAASHNFSVLGLTRLAGGRYTEIRLYVKSAKATLQNGQSVTVTIPGKANIVRIVQPFVVVSGKTTTLSMYFDAQNSVLNAGGNYILKPVVARLQEANQ